MKLTLVEKVTIIYIITLIVSCVLIGAAIILYFQDHGTGALAAMVGAMIMIAVNVFVEGELYPLAVELEKNAKH